VPVKHPEAAMSPEQRRREVAALLGLAVRRLAKRPGVCAGISLEQQFAFEAEGSPEHGCEPVQECAPEHGSTGHHLPICPHRFPSRSPLDGAEDAGRDRPLPVGLDGSRG
jgi:hypothetical protein